MKIKIVALDYEASESQRLPEIWNSESEKLPF